DDQQQVEQNLRWYVDQAPEDKDQRPGNQGRDVEQAAIDARRGRVADTIQQEGQKDREQDAAGYEDGGELGRLPQPLPEGLILNDTYEVLEAHEVGLVGVEIAIVGKAQPQHPQ